MCWRLLGSGRLPALFVPNVTSTLSLLLICAFLVACEPPADRMATQGDGSVLIASELLEPPAIGPAPLVVRLTGPDGAGIDGASVRVEGDMTHAGMQPVLV